MRSMEYKTIAYGVADRVATITLDRPDRLNTFTVRMYEELVDAFDRVDGDDDVRVVVITGRGRAFCAGADLERGADTFRSAAKEESVGAASDGGSALSSMTEDGRHRDE